MWSVSHHSACSVSTVSFCSACYVRPVSSQSAFSVTVPCCVRSNIICLLSFSSVSLSLPSSSIPSIVESCSILATWNSIVLSFYCLDFTQHIPAINKERSGALIDPDISWPIACHLRMLLPLSWDEYWTIAWTVVRMAVISTAASVLSLLQSTSSFFVSPRRHLSLRTSTRRLSILITFKLLSRPVNLDAISLWLTWLGVIFVSLATFSKKEYVMICYMITQTNVFHSSQAHKIARPEVYLDDLENRHPDGGCALPLLASYTALTNPCRSSFVSYHWTSR